MSQERGQQDTQEATGGLRGQEATGGLVEVRGGDWEKIQKGGDTWVIMFYTPWCQRCASIAPSFQQVALQAPDAAEHPGVAEEEEEASVRNLVAFAKKEK